MVPEKVEAFSAAGMVMLNQSGEASRQMMRLASEEVMTTACATLEMTGCSSPAAWAEAQSRLARAWLSRGDLEPQHDGNAGANRPGRCDGTNSPDGRRQC